MVKKAAKKSAKKRTASKAKKTTAKPARTLTRARKSAKKTPSKAGVRKTPKAKVSPAKKGAKRLVKSPLTKKQLRYFRELLLAKRKDIIGDMSGIQAEALNNGAGGDLSNIPTHPADIGTDNFEQEFTLGLLESERTLLAEIDEALDRVESGVYGICLGTGQAIGLPRLTARPWAKYSIEYARMLEKGMVPSHDRDAPADQEEYDHEDADDVGADTDND